MMKRVQRPSRDKKPTPAAPRPAVSPGRKPSAATARPVEKAVKKPRPTGAPRAGSPASATAGGGAIVESAVPVAEASGSEKRTRRGLGTLGQQSLHRQLPTITLAVERPRAWPAALAAPSPASPARKAADPAVDQADLLRLREGLRRLLSLLDAPPAAPKM